MRKYRKPLLIRSTIYPQFAMQKGVFFPLFNGREESGRKSQAIIDCHRSFFSPKGNLDAGPFGVHKYYSSHQYKPKERRTDSIYPCIRCGNINVNNPLGAFCPHCEQDVIGGLKVKSTSHLNNLLPEVGLTGRQLAETIVKVKAVQAV